MDAQAYLNQSRGGGLSRYLPNSLLITPYFPRKSGLPDGLLQ